MENKRLHCVFDQVKLSPRREEALLADLLREKEEVPNMKNRRRIPAAALAAAVLVIVLAGTAVAVEYFGKVDIELLDDYKFSFRHKDGYSVYLPEECVPAESLSEEFRAACGEGKPSYLSFASWSEAEEFMGLELADNAVLEEMYNSIIYYTKEDGKKAYARCLVSTGYIKDSLPSTICLDAAYDRENCHITQMAQFSVGSGDLSQERQVGLMVPREEGADFQEYVTPSGLEVTIYSEVVTEPRLHNDERTTYRAHFVKNNALFTVSLHSFRNWEIGRESREMYDPWDTLIEILDAYE